MTPEALAELVGRLVALLGQLEIWLPEAPRQRGVWSELWPLLLSGGFGAGVALGGTWFVQHRLLQQADRAEERRIREAETRQAHDLARRELAPVLLRELAWTWEERSTLNPLVVAQNRSAAGRARGVQVMVFEGPYAPQVPQRVADAIHHWFDAQTRAEEFFASRRERVRVEADDSWRAYQLSDVLIWLGFDEERGDEDLQSALVSVTSFSGPEQLEVLRNVLATQPAALAAAESFAAEQNRLIDEARGSAVLVRGTLVSWLNRDGPNV